MSSQQPISQFYVHTECCCRRCCCCCCCCCLCSRGHCCCYYCCCCCSVGRYTAVVAAAAVLLRLAAVRHRVLDGRICCWFIESAPSVFSSFKCDLHLMVPLGNTVAFTASIFLYPRACTEPRRASVHLGEASLVYFIINLL